MFHRLAGVLGSRSSTTRRTTAPRARFRPGLERLESREVMNAGLVPTGAAPPALPVWNPWDINPGSLPPGVGAVMPIRISVTTASDYFDVGSALLSDASLGTTGSLFTAQELYLASDGPIICQALFQRLAPRAPANGAQVNSAVDRFIIFYEPGPIVPLPGAGATPVVRTPVGGPWVPPPHGPGQPAPPTPTGQTPANDPAHWLVYDLRRFGP
jgi:hypothetical protein